MMPNLLQYPVCLFGAWRAGCVVVNCNPLYTAHELEHQLADSGARAIVVADNFARSRPAQERHRARAGHLHRRIAGPAQGRLVDLVVKRVKRMVPAWSIPGAQRLGQAARRPRPALHRGRAEPGRPGLPAIHGRHHRRGQGGHAVPRQPDGQRQPGARLGEPLVRDGEELIVTALPLYHIFALTANCLTFMKIGASNLLIVNPRDIPGLIKEMSRRRSAPSPGQHAVQRAAEQPRFRQAGFRACA